MLEKTKVSCHAVAALGYRGQAVQKPAVQFSGISLAADVKAGIESKVRADIAIHLVDFFLVSLKELHETGLCSRSAPAAQELHKRKNEINFFQICEKILHPQRGPFSYGNQLGRLVVGVA